MSVTGEPPIQPWKIWDKKANKQGERHTVFWVNNERYQGEWNKNKKHGKGTQLYANGNKYEGEWHMGRRQGNGTMWLYESGKYRVEYNGFWMADKPHGWGVYYNEKGERYEGEWVAGKRHGKGRQGYGGRIPDGFGGDIYEGLWKDDQRCGRGTLTMANGDLYEGEWESDMKHGEGHYYYESKGRRFDGVWLNDTPKCGEYMDIQPGTLPSDIPVLELTDTAGVLRTAKRHFLLGESEFPK